VTAPYAVKLATLGFKKAIESDPGLKAGVNTYQGHITHQAVAESQGLGYTPIEALV
jgi:alanine dehydrogenase